MTETIDLEDGRLARRAGTRRRMLLAGLKLMQRQKTYRLSPKDVTDYCKMSPRIFHTVFGDMDGFNTELIGEYGQTLTEMIKADVSEHHKPLVRLVLLGK